MSGIIHKIEEEIKHKMENVLHLGHKEEEGHKKNDHPKAEHGGEGQHLKELMHKIKNKMGGHGGKKRRAKGGHKEGEEYKEGEGGEELEEESESESESESEEENGGGEFEFEF